MILQKIAEDTRKRVASQMLECSMEEMKDRAKAFKSSLPAFAFEHALKQDGINFICEVKKASPSKGLIAGDFPYVKIAKDYEAAGASCISCLTEPHYFMGCDKYLTDIKDNVSIPVLRKDFTVDSYMIYQAKTLNADCVLLICSLLDKNTLSEYIRICDSLGMSALVEAHDESEIDMAISCGARIIGVNNRDLRTFSVDIHNSERLRNLVPSDILFVAESGIQSHKDISILQNANVNGVLIGETLMRAPDKAQMLQSLRGL